MAMISKYCGIVIKCTHRFGSLAAALVYLVGNIHKKVLVNLISLTIYLHIRLTMHNVRSLVQKCIGKLINVGYLIRA